ncbi:MAG: c-type cytochrome [Alphaproteobacteria bacterium]
MFDKTISAKRSHRLVSAVAMAAVFTVAIGAGAVLIAPTGAAAAEMDSSYVRGGKLYDKWYKVIGADKPTESHQLYPSDAKYADDPGSNWRCKECHGWDYMGSDGAYASGSHSTGIKGINGLRGADPAAVVAILQADDHGYGDLLSEDDLMDLANFVTQGQIDTDPYIDRANKAVIGGDAEKGAAYFNTVCANCHREDGTRPKDMGKSLAAQMGNPWEVMHKIVNGQPHEQMPALRAFGMQPIVDIMAYVATLPVEEW